MSLMSTTVVLNDARRRGYCVGAFNFVDYLSIETVIEAAEKQNAPAILQSSSGTIKRFGIKTIVEMARIAAAGSSVPVSLHLDHGTNVDIISQAINEGYNSVMIDASSKPFEENIAITSRVVEEAHAKGISVEGEIGVVAGVEDDIVMSQDDAIYTTPEEAIEFKQRTNIDFLAAAIGTAHGFYKVEPRLDIDTLARIYKKTDYPLVVHGGTGLGDDVVKALVAAGASKFNVSTRIKQVYIDSQFEYISANRAEYNILKTLEHTRGALVEMIAHYIDILGGTGMAGGIAV